MFRQFRGEYEDILEEMDWNSPEGETEAFSYLKKLCEAGFQRRYGEAHLEYRVQLEGAGKTQDRVIGMLVPGDTLRLEMPGLERITISSAAGWEIGTWTS